MSNFGKEFRLGWRDLVGSTIGLACGSAAYNSLSSFFFRALEKEFGWSKTTTAFSLVSLALTAAFLPVVGYLIDRFGTRKMAILSAFCMSASFLWLSIMNGNIFVFYAAVLFLNVLGSGTGPVSYARAVVTTFTLSRGTALGISVAGTSLSTTVLPLIVWQLMTHYGWRGAYQFCAALALAGGVLAFFLIRPIREVAKTQVIEHLGYTVRQALRTRSFWALATAIFLSSAGAFGLVNQFQSVMIEKGFAPAAVPLMWALLSASSLFSKLIVGVAFDNLEPKRVAMVALWAAASGFGLLMAAIGNFPLAILSVIFIGISMGAEMDMLSFFSAHCFGLRCYSAIIGVLFVFFYIGFSVGGISYGFVHDRMGSYGLALAASMVEFTLAGFLMLWVRKSSPKKALDCEAACKSDPLTRRIGVEY